VNAVDEQGRTSLMEAVNGYKTDIIEYLLANGANINAQDHKGCTALMRAAYIGYPSLVNMLLENGADKYIKDNNANLAIHYVRKECLADLKDILK
ncbi:MAG: ankyrin repeat domain-containing protein, partial [Erysipelotrichaceae bacterium]|nr:ankyrin repeat domain-containing protein [Erysipelotrichaceae bacterium]